MSLLSEVEAYLPLPTPTDLSTKALEQAMSISRQCSGEWPQILFCTAEDLDYASKAVWFLTADIPGPVIVVLNSLAKDEWFVGNFNFPTAFVGSPGA
jgi:hypothetical protein